MPGRVIGDLSINLPHPRQRVSQAFVERLLRIRQVIADAASDERDGATEQTVLSNHHAGATDVCCFQDVAP